MPLFIQAAKKGFLPTFLLVVLYVAAFYGFQVFLHTMGAVANTPNEVNLGLWDAGWYRSIAEQGYKYTPGGNNTAFFFLFSVVWQVSHLGVWGISIFNTLLFAAGFSIVTGFFNLSVADKLLWLSVPSVYFCFIPYTESLFFLLSSLCIWGIMRHKMWLVWLSLFLLSLTRATAIFFIPALLFMELAANSRQSWLKSLSHYSMHYLLPIVLGTTAFVLYQFQATGVWFAYFKQQAEYWDRTFSMPVLPLTGLMGNEKTLWLSALCLFVCFIAFILLIRQLVQWLVKGKVTDRLLVLSAGYLSMVMYSIVFFNPTWLSLTTNVIGANRYTLVNPFFFIFLHHLTKPLTYTWKHYLVVFVISTLFWFFFGSYKDLHSVLFYSFNTAILFLYLLYADKKLSWPVVMITALNIFFQVYLFQQHIGGIMTD